MTTPNCILTADLRAVLTSLSTVTGIKAHDIVSGSGRAHGHVTARHAAFWMLREKGHCAKIIAEAFGQTKTGVQGILNRTTMHGKVRDVADKARFSLRPCAQEP